MQLLLLICVFPTAFAQTFPYLSESPVKLSRIDPYGELYPAAASEYRNSSDGYDQRWDLSKILHDQIFEPEISHTIFIHN